MPSTVNENGGGTAEFFDDALATNFVKRESHTEIQLLKFVHEHPRVNKARGNPSAVIELIDEYAATIPKGLMTIGPEKKDYIISVMQMTSPRPKVFIEFGGYVGYSAISLGAALRDLNGGEKVRYLSFEKSPVLAAITSSFVELAGLKEVVEVYVGAGADSVKTLVETGKLREEEVNFLLIDHWKDLYIPDLQLCERLRLMKKGTTVLGDNIVFPGAPEYLAYVQRGIAEQSSSGLRYETQLADFVLPFGGPDQLAITKVV